MKYLIALSLIFTVSSASTQETMPQPNNMKTFITKQPCAPFSEMLKTPAKYGESMLFTGTGLQFGAQGTQPFTGGMFFFTNQDTGTWTMLSVYGDGMACMVANGREFAPYVGGQPHFNQPEKDDL
jgi:hypothetical protein|tara:strand:+ start:1543 stop:1917 length:375 start_codon:yes stop_codon:yes gene_type:complete